DHGSPLWPFLRGPWGDPLPPTVAAANTSFLDAPKATIQGVGDLYLSRFLEGIVLLAAVVPVAVIVRRRPVLVAAGIALLSLLTWARAPFTGAPSSSLFIAEGTFSTTRYLLPGLAAAVLALALAAGGRGSGARLAQAAVAVAALIGAVQAFRLGYPAMPSPVTPLAGALAGGAVALAAWALRTRLPDAPGLRSAPVGVLAAVAVGALLAIPANGYVRRHADTGAFASRLSGWLDRQPADGRPVSSAPIVVGPLAGDRLKRRLAPIPANETCSELRGRARAGYVVLYVSALPSPDVLALARCLAPRAPDYVDRQFRAWGPR
ncbi:MAG TPA: hypothetical protein VGE42_11730, partial [Candidatus Dormibacteraeota bacterium]